MCTDYNPATFILEAVSVNHSHFDNLSQLQIIKIFNLLYFFYDMNTNF